MAAVHSGGRRTGASETDAATTITDIPPTASADMGKTDWEQRLIRVLRTRHYQWRTEQTYRGWAGRFAQWVEGCGANRPRLQTAPTVDGAGADDVRDFLSDLATRQRVSASTQKQALSALLFLYDEVLHTPLGWIKNVERAKRPDRLPVVLTRDEVQAILAQLSGTYRLMADLLYGSGLRLMDCVRLRVKDVDPFDFAQGRLR